eukprot:TRINITY_DN1365_c0_g1_i1.p1 TRINITY_DN1365_c0_g1~~TRINITY_DN1365_c0_g1_i1.p1  ORF type:complete len:531 (-),score=138.49 TRINITY_DN1365_c0_g1_i1:68-1609(-)
MSFGTQYNYAQDLSSSSDRIAQFKQGIDKNESRRKRQEMTLNARRNRRFENLRKKRNVDVAPVDLGDLQSGDMPKLMQMIMGDDTSVYVESVKSIKKLLSQENNPPIGELVQHPQVVRRMVEFLYSSNYDLQFETAWALTNVASGTSEQTIAVVEAGAIPAFINLLRHQREEIREQSIWALGNISGESSECRDAILEQNGMEAIVANLENGSKAIIKNAIWTVSNLCRGKQKPNKSKINICIPHVCHLLEVLEDGEALADCMWSLSYLTDGDDYQITRVIQELDMRRFLNLVKSGDDRLYLPGVRTLGNIASGSDDLTEMLVDHGTVSVLSAVLGLSNKRSVQKEAIWTLSNIAASSTDMIQVLLDDGILTTVLYLLTRGQAEVKRECLWTIANIVSCGTSNQIVGLVNLGCIPPLVEFLDVKDVKQINAALDTIDGILRTGEKVAIKSGIEANPFGELFEKARGLDKLEDLQEHDQDSIYKKSVHLMDRYFETEEQVDEDNNINIPQTGFNF